MDNKYTGLINKHRGLINMCKGGIPLTNDNVGEDMILIDRGTFQLVLLPGNTDSYGAFFVNSIKGHDCYSFNSESTHTYYIIDGMGQFIIDDVVFDVKPESTITIDPNKVFTYTGNMIMILEMTPNFKEENDHFVKKVDYSAVSRSLTMNN